MFKKYGLILAVVVAVACIGVALLLTQRKPAIPETEETTPPFPGGGTSFEDAILTEGPVFTETRDLEAGQSVYYKFWVDEDRSFEMEIENIVEVSIYDPNRVEIEREEVSGAYGYTGYADVSGDHYIVVRGPQQVRYSIAIRIAQPAEPGETFETAQEIELDVVYQYGDYGAALQRTAVTEYTHYYKFYIEAGTEDWINASVGGVGEWEKEFLNPNGSSLGESIAPYEIEVGGWYRFKLILRESPVHYLLRLMRY